MSLDSIWRHLIQHHAPEVLQLLLGPSAPRFVRLADSSLPATRRDSDSLLVMETDGSEWLVHVEFQAQRDANLPRRILEYAVRAHARDELPVLSIVAYLSPEVEVAPSPYSMRCGHAG